MTQAQQVRFMKRVMGSTPGGGSNSLLHLLGEAVRLNAPNPDANDRVTSCAATLDNLAQLATAAAALVRDPDFVAKNWDVFDDQQWTELGDRVPISIESRRSIK
jgi:hypothetical protein